MGGASRWRELLRCGAERWRGSVWRVGTASKGVMGVEVRRRLMSVQAARIHKIIMLSDDA